MTYTWALFTGTLSILLIIVIAVLARLPDRALQVTAQPMRLCTSNSSAGASAGNTSGLVGIADVTAAGPVDVKLTEVTLSGIPVTGTVVDLGSENTLEGSASTPTTQTTATQDVPGALVRAGQTVRLYITLPSPSPEPGSSASYGTLTIEYHAYWTTRTFSIPLTPGTANTCEAPESPQRT